MPWVARALILLLLAVAAPAAAQAPDQPATARPAQPHPAQPHPAQPHPAQPHPAQPGAERGQGVIVVAKGEAARPHARELARRVYRDAALRPRIDEQMAKVLAGEPAVEGDDVGAAQRAEVAEVVAALELADEGVAKRLLTSTANELNAKLVVVVSNTDEGPSARVLRASSGSFVGVSLAAQKVSPTEPGGAPGWSWSEALPILKSLLDGPPPGPRARPVRKPAPARAKKATAPAPVTATEPAEGEEESNLLASPWFWGGLGVVVAAGVTVLVLSQTTFKDADQIRVQGRVSP